MTDFIRITFTNGSTLNFLYVPPVDSVYYNEKEIWSATEKTFVKIRALKNEEIDLYLKKSGKKILFSVGCYQIEAYGPNIIEKIEGDFFNVMGFPLFPFLNFLKKFNIKV